jgi:two-component system chemotaxis response regulator CheY
MTRTILLIDDDKDELDVLEEALHVVDKTAMCKQCENLDEALDYLLHEVPDYIFIDFNMPRENGLQCLAELKKIRKLDQSRIILYSNHVSDDMNQQALAMGAYTCFKKPNMINVLAKKLKDVFNHHQGF